MAESKESAVVPFEEEQDVLDASKPPALSQPPINGGAVLPENVQHASLDDILFGGAVEDFMDYGPSASGLSPLFQNWPTMKKTWVNAYNNTYLKEDIKTLTDLLMDHYANPNSRINTVHTKILELANTRNAEGDLLHRGSILLAIAQFMMYPYKDEMRARIQHGRETGKDRPIFPLEAKFLNQYVLMLRVKPDEIPTTPLTQGYSYDSFMWYPWCNLRYLCRSDIAVFPSERVRDSTRNSTLFTRRASILLNMVKDFTTNRPTISEMERMVNEDFILTYDFMANRILLPVHQHPRLRGFSEAVLDRLKAMNGRPENVTADKFNDLLNELPNAALSTIASEWLKAIARSDPAASYDDLASRYFVDWELSVLYDSFLLSMIWPMIPVYYLERPCIPRGIPLTDAHDHGVVYYNFRNERFVTSKDRVLTNVETHKLSCDYMTLRQNIAKSGQPLRAQVNTTDARYMNTGAARNSTNGATGQATIERPTPERNYVVHRNVPPPTPPNVRGNAVRITAAPVYKDAIEFANNALDKELRKSSGHRMQPYFLKSVNQVITDAKDVLKQRARGDPRISPQVLEMYLKYYYREAWKKFQETNGRDWGVPYYAWVTEDHHLYDENWNLLYPLRHTVNPLDDLPPYIQKDLAKGPYNRRGHPDDEPLNPRRHKAVFDRLVEGKTFLNDTYNSDDDSASEEGDVDMDNDGFNDFPTLPGDEDRYGPSTWEDHLKQHREKDRAFRTIRGSTLSKTSDPRLPEWFRDALDTNSDTNHMLRNVFNGIWEDRPIEESLQSIQRIFYEVFLPAYSEPNSEWGRQLQIVSKQFQECFRITGNRFLDEFAANMSNSPEHLKDNGGKMMRVHQAIWYLYCNIETVVRNSIIRSIYAAYNIRLPNEPGWAPFISPDNPLVKPVFKTARKALWNVVLELQEHTPRGTIMSSTTGTGKTLKTALAIDAGVDSMTVQGSRCLNFVVTSDSNVDNMFQVPKHATFNDVGRSAKSTMSRYFLELREVLENKYNGVTPREFNQTLRLWKWNGPKQFSWNDGLNRLKTTSKGTLFGGGSGGGGGNKPMHDAPSIPTQSPMTADTLFGGARGSSKKGKSKAKGNKKASKGSKKTSKSSKSKKGRKHGKKPLRLLSQLDDPNAEEDSDSSSDYEPPANGASDSDDDSSDDERYRNGVDSDSDDDRVTAKEAAAAEALAVRHDAMGMAWDPSGAGPDNGTVGPQSPLDRDDFDPDARVRNKTPNGCGNIMSYTQLANAIRMPPTHQAYRALAHGVFHLDEVQALMKHPKGNEIIEWFCRQKHCRIKIYTGTIALDLLQAINVIRLTQWPGEKAKRLSMYLSQLRYGESINPNVREGIAKNLLNNVGYFSAIARPRGNPRTLMVQSGGPNFPVMLKWAPIRCSYSLFQFARVMDATAFATLREDQGNRGSVIGQPIPNAMASTNKDLLRGLGRKQASYRGPTPKVPQDLALYDIDAWTRELNMELVEHQARQFSLMGLSDDDLTAAFEDDAKPKGTHGAKKPHLGPRGLALLRQKSRRLMLEGLGAIPNIFPPSRMKGLYILEFLNVWNTKVAALIENIQRLMTTRVADDHAIVGGKHIIFTGDTWTGAQKGAAHPGVMVIAAALEANGFTNISKEFFTHTKTDEEASAYARRFHGKTFVITSGGEAAKMMMHRLNMATNHKGHLVPIIILRPGDEEGLDFKDIRFLHSMAESLEEDAQFQGRAQRMCAMASFDREDQTVHYFKYIASVHDETLHMIKDIQEYRKKVRNGDYRKIEHTIPKYLQDELNEVHMFWQKNADDFEQKKNAYLMKLMALDDPTNKVLQESYFRNYRKSKYYRDLNLDQDTIRAIKTAEPFQRTMLYPGNLDAGVSFTGLERQATYDKATLEKALDGDDALDEEFMGPGTKSFRRKTPAYDVDSDEDDEDAVLLNANDKPRRSRRLSKKRRTPVYGGGGGDGMEDGIQPVTAAQYDAMMGVTPPQPRDYLMAATHSTQPDARPPMTIQEMQAHIHASHQDLYGGGGDGDDNHSLEHGASGATLPGKKAALPDLHLQSADEVVAAWKASIGAYHKSMHDASEKAVADGNPIADDDGTLYGGGASQATLENIGRFTPSSIRRAEAAHAAVKEVLQHGISSGNANKIIAWSKGLRQRMKEQKYENTNLNEELRRGYSMIDSIWAAAKRHEVPFPVNLRNPQGQSVVLYEDAKVLFRIAAIAEHAAAAYRSIANLVRKKIEELIREEERLLKQREAHLSDEALKTFLVTKPRGVNWPLHYMSSFTAMLNHMDNPQSGVEDYMVLFNRKYAPDRFIKRLRQRLFLSLRELTEILRVVAFDCKILSRYHKSLGLPKTCGRVENLDMEEDDDEGEPETQFKGFVGATYSTPVDFAASGTQDQPQPSAPPRDPEQDLHDSLDAYDVDMDEGLPDIDDY